MVALNKRGYQTLAPVKEQAVRLDRIVDRVESAEKVAVNQTADKRVEE